MLDLNKYKLYWVYLELKYGSAFVNQEILLKNLMEETEDYVNLKILSRKRGEDDEK